MSATRPSVNSSYRLGEHIYNWGRHTPVYIVMHFTGGFSDSKSAMLSIYKSYLARGSNAHYLVGASDIWEMVNPHTYYCGYSCGSPVGRKNACLAPGWGPSAYKGTLSMSHAGIAGHSNTINVEVCSCKEGNKRCDPLDDGWYFSDETYVNTVRLVSWLCDEFGIRTDRIIMHNQVTGKLCPAMWCNRPGAEAGFEQFRKDVSAVLNEVEEDTPVSPSPKPMDGTIIVAADSLYYSRPNVDSIVVGMAQTDATEGYTLRNGDFYYTDKGWTQA